MATKRWEKCGGHQEDQEDNSFVNSMLLVAKPGYLEECRSCIPAKNNSLMARE